MEVLTVLLDLLRAVYSLETSQLLLCTSQKIFMHLSDCPCAQGRITPAGTREAVGIEVRETIDLCRSEKGQEIRSNAEKLKVELAKADGPAKQEICRQLEVYLNLGDNNVVT